MRACLFAFLFSVISAVAQTETNIACVERLEIPAYPRLAGMARISGVVISSVALGSDASIVGITSTSDHGKPHPLLVPSVEKSLRISTFAKTCAGKQVKLVFNFTVEGGPVSSFQWNPIVSFGYPNQFWIKAPEIEINP